MDVQAVIGQLRERADPSRKPGMARVGIDVSQALGVSMPNIRAIAKACGVDHTLALGLWKTGIHEARILATLVADPEALTEIQRERWRSTSRRGTSAIRRQTSSAAQPSQADAIRAWARRPEAFVKRYAFSMIARRSVWAKQAPDREFLGYLLLIRRAVTDDRNEVKKGVSWALRQIGKRNRALHAAAVEEAERILELEARSARWIARDVLRELGSEKTRSRLPD
jgi:3-methyladenine DNA glycosylase AlkD